MMKRKLIAPLLALLLLTGCGGLDKQSPGSILADNTPIAPVDTTQEAAEIPEGAIVDNSGEFYYDGQLMQIGDDENGYIQVPLGFVQFQDVDVEGLTQYSDSTGRNIITLERYDGINYKTVAENLRSFLASDETVDDLQGSTVQVAGYDALRIYGHYTDGYAIVIWFIEDPADTDSSYYLAMEFDSEHYYLIACSSTFQTVEDHNAKKDES